MQANNQKIYKLKKGILWIYMGICNLISVNTKENFFEFNVSQYNKANVGSTQEDREIVFDCDDF